MGERAYDVNGKSIRFSDVDEEFGCLCTFPHNNREILYVEDVKALALLGAAVVYAIHEEDEMDDYVFLPQGIPKWIVDGIRKVRMPKEK